LTSVNHLTRRSLLKGSAGFAFAAALGGGVLTACGSDDQATTGDTSGAGETPGASGGATSSAGSSSPGSASAGGGKSVLPAFMPYTGLTPDEPATKEGAAPYFAHYPADPQTFSPQPPASGGEITALCIIPKPVKIDGNQYYDALNTMLGTKLNFVGVPNENYPDKFATMVAGNQIPDLAQIYSTASDLVDLLDAKFEDLTDYLAGDKVKQYPGLANIPTYCWQNAVYGGKLYGVPLQRTPVATWGCVRAQSAKDAGVNPQPKDGKEFLALCKALTNTKKNQWALRNPPNVLGWVNAMVGTPNNWAVEGGKFTSAYATPQMKQALSTVRQLWTDGCFEPDTLSETNTQKIDWYVSGRVPIYVGASSWGTVATRLKEDSGGESAVIQPPKWDGGGIAKSYMSSGILTITSIKKTDDKSRVEELLRVLNVLAAPFGTKEYLQKIYGIKGRDYTLNGTDPVQTDTGKAESMAQFQYVANCPGVQYSPSYPDLAKLAYQSEAAALKDSWPWPTAGLYSPTDQKQGAALKKKLDAVALDIMVNRKPVSAWDTAVKDWKSGGGDKIASEYEESLQKSGGAS
jgi:putative aldouronate transport system substrate-binding protein